MQRNGLTDNHSLFQDSNREERAKELFKYVDSADYDKAAEYIKQNPKLMFFKTLYHEVNISPLQFTFMTYDTYMRNMFYEQIKDDVSLSTRFKNQAEAIQNYLNLSPLFKVYESYIDIVEQFYKNPPMEEKIKLRDEAYETVKALRLMQRLIPAHMIREFCRKDNNWGKDAKFDHKEPPKEAFIYNDHEANLVYRVLFLPVLPYKPNKGLGYDYALARDGEKCFGFRMENGTAPEANVMQNNLDGFRKLFEQRKNEYHQFFPNIQPALEQNQAYSFVTSITEVDNEENNQPSRLCRIV